MSWWEKEYYHNTILEYLTALGIILGAIIAGKLLYWLTKNVVKKLTEKTKTNLDDILVDKVEEPVIFGLVMWACWYALGLLEYGKLILKPEDKDFSFYFEYMYGVAPTPEQLESGVAIVYPYWENFVHHLFGFIIVVNITWLIVRVIDALIEEYIVPLTEKSESDLDDQLLPIFRKGMKIIIWSLGIIVGLNNAGYDVGAILAGLGIGGLAFALAAQDTVKNFFGGIMIFADKPFQIGERIRIGGIDGTVEEIGIRSTRVRTLEGRLVTVPNSKFSDDAVENVDREPTRKIVLNLGLTYDTPPEGMEKAMELLQQISNDHQDKIEEEPVIGFNAFGDFSLGVLYVYYIRKEADIIGTQTAINMDILKRFNTEGLDMAFPTQTIIQQQG